MEVKYSVVFPVGMKSKPLDGPRFVPLTARLYIWYVGYAVHVKLAHTP